MTSDPRQMGPRVLVFDKKPKHIPVDEVQIRLVNLGDPTRDMVVAFRDGSAPNQYRVSVVNSNAHTILSNHLYVDEIKMLIAGLQRLVNEGEDK